VRYLFAFTGGTGHFLPTSPLATALQRRGHEVACTCQRAVQRTVEQAERWRPDVIMRDEVDFGAAVAAEFLAVPWAPTSRGTPTAVATWASRRSSLPSPPRRRTSAGR
jgi:hypothetical protein